MPGSTADVDAIESTLKKALSLNKQKSQDLDQNVASSAQRLLQQKVEFVPAKKPHSLQFSALKSKYILLKPSKKDPEASNSSSQVSSPGPNLEADVTATPNGLEATKMGESLSSPRVVIYPPERVQLGWRPGPKVGGGLVNMGNTCFMNSILQCLTYTPPLVNYCLSDEHLKKCKQQGFCAMCMMKQHIKMALHRSGCAFKPNSILHKMKLIAKHFRYGRQEDAHEFLRLLVDALQKSCLDGHKKLDRLSKETTVIHQIFGGFLRSQVQCLKCSARSNTYEPFMDLSLNLKDVTTMEGALAKFVKPETLASANAYACERCGQKTQARKKFSLHKIPSVLTVQLNRFGFSRATGKINRHIQFPEKLNIRPYMSHRQGEAEYYNLYAVVIHSGHHCSMGHYYCYVRAPNNVWHIMNDSSVHPVSASRVFESQAYLLFYIKAAPSLSQVSPKTPLIATPSTPMGLVSPIKLNGAFSGKQSATASSSSTATPKASSSGDVGVPVSRQMVSPTKAPHNPFFTGCSAGAGAVSLSASQKRDAFSEDAGLKGSKGDESFKDRCKENDASDSSKSPKDFLKNRKRKHNDMEGCPVQTPVKGKSDWPEKDMVEANHPLKLKKENSAGASKTSEDLHADSVPELKKEKSTSSVNNLFDGADVSGTLKQRPSIANSEDVNKWLFNESSVPKLKKRHSDILNNVLKDVQLMLARVNSSPAVHNVWHVHTLDSVPSPSLGANYPIPSTTGEWTVNADNNHSTPADNSSHQQQQLYDNAQQTLTGSGKKQPLLSKSFDQVPKVKLRISFPADTHTEDKQVKKLKVSKLANTPTEDSSSDHKKKKRHKDPSMSDDGDDAPARKSLKLSESDKLLKEHSKGTPEKKDKDTRQDLNKPVLVQAWDHYVKDSLVKKKGQGEESAPHIPTPLIWDGSKKSEVVEELRKKPTVGTWSGEKSEAEIEAGKEEKRRKKKSWKDHYEEETDTGKVKKVKKKADETPWAFNPFQKYQNHKNNEKYKSEEALLSCWHHSLLESVCQRQGLFQAVPKWQQQQQQQQQQQSLPTAD